MDLGRALLDAGLDERPEHFSRFAEAIDPAWTAQALQAHGAATVRRRKLPAEQALWLVIGMGLFRDHSIQQVAHHLDLVLPSSQPGTGTPSLTSAAVVQARNRLGAGPLEQLFQQVATAWAVPSAARHAWRGLSVFGIDGSSLRVPDTPENAAAFGRPATGRAGAGYPQVRLAALMALRSHLLAGLAVGPWTTGEVTLAAGLWDLIPDQSLTILDKGFLSYGHLSQLQAGGRQRHWLIPAKSNLQFQVVKRLGPKDHLVEITHRAPARRQFPDLPETMTFRRIQYHRQGFRPRTLLTSLLDPVAFPAAEIAALYHERWELELGFDELKTHTLEREETLRSKTPERILQEVWGLALAYNLVRWHMEQIAGHVGVVPSRISYRHTLLLLRGFWLSAWFASPGTLPRHLATLATQTQLLVLPPRRTRRAYPRKVKIKMSGYPRNA